MDLSANPANASHPPLRRSALAGTADLAICFIPVLAWICVVILRILVEGPVEEALAKGQAAGGHELIAVLEKERQKALLWTSPSGALVAKRGSSFAVYATLALLYIATAVLIVMICYLWSRSCCRSSSLPSHLAALPTIVCFLLAVVFFYLANASPRTDFVLTWKGFGSLLRSTDPTGFVIPWVSLTKIATGFGFSGAFAILALACSLLLPHEGTYEENRELHRKAFVTLDFILIAGTTLFLFAILRDRAFFNYADSLFATEALENAAGRPKTAIQYLADGIITVNGVYLSLLTAAVYLPSAFILNRRTERLIPASIRLQPFCDRQAWLQKHDLTRTFTDNCLRAGTVLAPAVTGGVSGLLEAFG